MKKLIIKSIIWSIRMIQETKLGQLFFTLAAILIGALIIFPFSTYTNNIDLSLLDHQFFVWFGFAVFGVGWALISADYDARVISQGGSKDLHNWHWRRATVRIVIFAVIAYGTEVQHFDYTTFNSWLLWFCKGTWGIMWFALVFDPVLNVERNEYKGELKDYIKDNLKYVGKIDLYSQVINNGVLQIFLELLAACTALLAYYRPMLATIPAAVLLLFLVIALVISWLWKSKTRK